MKILALFLSVLTISEISKADSPNQISISQVRAQGRGCSSGTFAANISPDGAAFSLLLDNYQAESNGNMTLERKDCQIQIDIKIDPGWSFAVVSADYRGFAHVEAGSVVTHQAIYSFDGSRPLNEKPGFENGKGYAFRSQEIRGPFLDNYFIRNEIQTQLAPWSPCNIAGQQTLFISTYLMARTLTHLTQSTATINLDSVDGALQAQNYKLQWRRCDPSRVDPIQPPRPNPRPTPPVRPPRFGFR